MGRPIARRNLLHGVAAAAAGAMMPLSAAAKEQMLRLLTTKQNAIPQIPQEEKEDYLYSLSYLGFLAKDLGLT